MASRRLFLIGSTIMIYTVTAFAVATVGFNWPVVFFGDLIGLDWRSHFNADVLIHLFLLATWIAWREGFTPLGFVFGFLSIFMGGMFGFPYLLVATYRANGDPRRILLGVHAEA